MERFGEFRQSIFLLEFLFSSFSSFFIYPFSILLHWSNFIFILFSVIWKKFLKNIFTTSNKILAMYENNHKRCSIDNPDRTNENKYHQSSFQKTKNSIAKYIYLFRIIIIKPQKE